uniref:Ion transport domain-containing protein n=1 Tax=Meloidogyne incognita TaxID=6306 RepID=A0A914LMS4_MELIC
MAAHVQPSSDKQHKLYQLVDMHGGGELIKWMRYARKGGDYAIVDGYFETTIKQAMYQAGKGKLQSVAELVKSRNKERNEHLGAFSRKKGKGKSGPNILDDFNQDQENQGDLKKALKLLDGGKGGKGDAKYREIVWKIEERGSMGENLVGCCLMQGGPIHTELAIRLLNQFPKLVNDVMLSEDYYGKLKARMLFVYQGWAKSNNKKRNAKLAQPCCLSPLHQAIVNEDPSLCNYLLQHGADVNQRCYGAFFCPDDQKGSRTDSLEHEYVELSLKTDYGGRMYFGEYPLAFAACTNQFDCYRLLRAKKADPNSQDTNGNACLHMTVIHENMEMLKLVYDTGGRLQLLNKQNLTPLTLAAKLAKKKMFQQILQLESEYLWDYGQASSIAYPLAKIDTINEENGNLNENSALYLVVYGESEAHLEMLDGLLEDLLDAKWEAFAKRRWFMSLFGFCFFYIIFSLAYMCRPFSATTWVVTGGNISYTGEVVNNGSISPIDMISFVKMEEAPIMDSGLFGFSLHSPFYEHPRCHLWHYTVFGIQGYIRMVCEPLTIAIVLFQLAGELWDIHSIGHVRWWQILITFPTKIFYKMSLLLIIGVVPIRFACGLGDFMLFLDNMFSISAVVLISLHFLYYCRAVKFVGPFVLMIYKIITQDLLRFFLIYFVFLFGFSQGFYIVFLSCERARLDREKAQTSDPLDATSNIIKNPFEAVIRVFIMTTGEYQTFYGDMSTCQEPTMSTIGKILFFIYEVFSSLMQFNVLIAMMTRTYEMIYATEKEWKRQAN